MELNIGDKVLYRKGDKLYEGIIKSIRGDKIEIDDDTIKMVIVAISKGTIADNLTFKKGDKKNGTEDKISKVVNKKGE